ncbi:MAG: pilus assembly protein PilP [Deltaproteobacteria bacterium]|nr:pilus assembly protein PilP [Deltaproteobacteria bacterium]
MRRPRKSEKRKSKGTVKLAGAVMLLAVICVFFCVKGAFASSEVVYKGPKPKKDLPSKLTTLGIKPAETYTYDRRGKTDPFKSFIAEQEDTTKKKRKKPRTYLETLDLSQLDLIAIIVGPKGNFAMVRDAKGLGYVIKKGTPIGINGGVVSQVNEGEVIIREGSKDISKKLYALP